MNTIRPCLVCGATDSLPRPPAINVASSGLARALLASHWYASPEERGLVDNRMGGTPIVCSSSCGDRFVASHPTAAAYLAAVVG